MTDLHIHWDSTGIADEIVEAVKRGEPVVALGDVKRGGILYTRGDVIPEFGTGRGDHHLLRRGVVLPEKMLRAYQLEHAIDDWERDRLNPAQAAAYRAADDLARAEDRVELFKAQLGIAKRALAASEKHKAAVEKELDAIIAAKPTADSVG